MPASQTSNSGHARQSNRRNPGTTSTPYEISRTPHGETAESSSTQNREYNCTGGQCQDETDDRELRGASAEIDDPARSGLLEFLRRSWWR